MHLFNANQDTLFHLGAKAICERLVGIAETLPNEAPVVWGLCGGRSPVGLFRALIPELAGLSPAVLSRFRVFQVDERLFEEHNQSDLESQIFTPLISQRLLRREQICLFPLPSDRSYDEARSAARSYESALQGVGGRFHVAVLGVGEDGHVAGTFPHHQSSEESREGFFVYEGSPKPPPGRVTATLPLLARSELGILLLLGEGKRIAQKNFQDPEKTIEECPAKIVLSMKDSLILTDLS